MNSIALQLANSLSTASLAFAYNLPDNYYAVDDCISLKMLCKKKYWLPRFQSWTQHNQFLPPTKPTLPISRSNLTLKQSTSVSVGIATANSTYLFHFVFHITHLLIQRKRVSILGRYKMVWLRKTASTILSVAQSGSRIGRSNGNLTKHWKGFIVNEIISLLFKLLDTELLFEGHREHKSL